MARSPSTRPSQPTKSAPTSTPIPTPSPRPLAPEWSEQRHSLDTRALPLDTLQTTEWLLTNALGGFAMGTALGTPTRRYHGLLIAATRPPGRRHMVLTALAETLVVNPEAAAPTLIDLSTFAFKGPPMAPAILHPNGHTHLVGFDVGLTARWTYEAQIAPTERVRVIKEVCLHDAVNVTGIKYTVERVGFSQSDANRSFTPLRLHVRPLSALRGIHELSRRAHADRTQFTPAACGVDVALDHHTLSLASDNAVFNPAPDWWHDFFYQVDQSRGQGCFEDLFSPGYFILDVPTASPRAAALIQASTSPGELLEFTTSNQSRAERRTLAAFAASRSAPSLLSADAPTLSDLLSAADAFVVMRAVKGASNPTAPDSLLESSIIAGYPWFSDWGRDTFISLPGLLLCTGRHDEARRVLASFAAHRKDGIIPNVFSEETGEPEYNTVDASLWFIHAACRYLEATHDRAFFDTHLLPACLEVISCYRRGTHFNIAMDPMDKLITAGAEGTQLTWMDARRDGVVFTPRHGKPVEISALWYNAIASLADALRPTDPGASANFADLAQAIAKSFRRAFWNADGRCLFDVLAPSENGGWHPVSDLRPNQIFAASLPHSPLAPEQRRAVIDAVRTHLFTPLGLQTLDPRDPRFRPRYEGNLFERDGAYHNGTAWPWLLPQLAEATLRTENFSPSSRSQAQDLLSPLIASMRTIGNGCLGSIAEVYDAQPPQRAQGCTAQAWSVAETLRVFLLSHTPPAASVEK